MTARGPSGSGPARVAAAVLAASGAVLSLAACGGERDRGPLAVVGGGGGYDAQAAYSGRLGIGMDCVTLTMNAEIVYTIIWRADDVRWDAQRRVITVETENGDDLELKDGDTIELGGGSFGAPKRWESAPAPSCPDRYVSAHTFG